MITESQVLPLLVRACPSFKGEYDKNVNARADSYWFDGEKLLTYIVLGDFARHVISLYRSKKIDEFSGIFLAVEQLHLEGDSYVKEAATVGLLEGIQNIARNSDLNPEVFVEYLLPESRRCWQELNDFWSGKK